MKKSEKKPFVEVFKTILDYVKLDDEKLLKSMQNNENAAQVTYDGVQGMTYIMLDKVSKINPKLAGNTACQRALVHQWLEYHQKYLMNLDPSTCISDYTLNELNTGLARTYYFAGNHMTIVDIAMFLKIYPIFKMMTYQEKERYVHISRWLRLLQQDTELMKDKEPILFSNTILY